MRKLNDVLKKTGVEIYREITAVALYSMITSLVLVTVVMFVPLMVALLLLPVLYMPLFYGVCYAYHRKTERGKSRLKDVFQGAIKGLGPAVVMGFFFVVMALILWSTWWYYGAKRESVILRSACSKPILSSWRSSPNSTPFSLSFRKGWGSSRPWRTASSCS